MVRGIRWILLITSALVAAATLVSCVRPLSWTWGARDCTDASRGSIVLRDGRIAVGVFDPGGTPNQTPRLDDLLSRGYVPQKRERLMA